MYIYIYIYLFLYFCNYKAWSRLQRIYRRKKLTISTASAKSLVGLRAEGLLRCLFGVLDAFRQASRNPALKQSDAARNTVARTQLA